ncbi:hypothetical protein P148_SR1C00001G0062 [candidate division SR1 bacterium RAAC1_SR1_1]|nr:hypothetical protein P148_SR1C00001G0062 [candidate division SR1 bacterium RAAC1_SR1_1]
MATKDLKKIEHAPERHEIAEDIVSIRNLKSFTQEKREVLIKELLAQKELTQTPRAYPFPQHKGYAEVWKSLTPDQQKEMKDNIRVTTDGKVEMIKMKKKFSALTAKHNGKDIFDGSHVDGNGNTGIKGVTYLTGKAAEKEAKNQRKKLLKDKSEIEQFISFFPGEGTKEKVFNFVKLFGLEKAGCWHPNNKEWNGVGSVGYVRLSRVNGNDNVYVLKWFNDNVSINRGNQEYPSPFLAFEDC